MPASRTWLTTTDAKELLANLKRAERENQALRDRLERLMRKAETMRDASPYSQTSESES